MASGYCFFSFRNSSILFNAISLIYASVPELVSYTHNGSGLEDPITSYASSVPAGNYHLLDIKMTSTDGDIFVNGVFKGGYSFDYTPFTLDFNYCFLGRLLPVYYFDGSIGELKIMPGLTTLELAAIRSELMTKWGL